MAYNGLTNAGAAYKAAREANNLPVEFLKAKVGNGIVPSGTDPAELTDIISRKMEVEITDIHQVERALKMTVQVSNESLATGFYLTEIAIYVNDNGTSVLYWYIGKDNGTYVPDSTKPMKYKNILNIEVSSTPITTVNYTGKELWVDEEALKKKFGTREGEILEGHRLAQSLGLEFGGELNNNNLKQAGKAYYDTLNKSIYKCLVDNTTDYADTSKFEAISNDDLLLKLQNLTKITDVFLIEINPDTPAGTRYMLPFNANSYKKISVIAYEIYHGVTTSVNMEYQSHWNLSGIRAFRYHLLDKYSLFLEISQNNEILIKENSVSLDRKQYIYRLEFWGELPKN